MVWLCLLQPIVEFWVPSWSWIYRDPPTSACWVLALQLCIQTTPNVILRLQDDLTKSLLIWTNCVMKILGLQHILRIEVWFSTSFMTNKEDLIILFCIAISICTQKWIEYLKVHSARSSFPFIAIISGQLFITSLRCHSQQLWIHGHWYSVHSGFSLKNRWLITFLIIAWRTSLFWHLHKIPLNSRNIV